MESVLEYGGIARALPVSPSQPYDTPIRGHVEICLNSHDVPSVAAGNSMKAYADQIRACVPGRYVVLVSDGFG